MADNQVIYDAWRNEAARLREEADILDMLADSIEDGNHGYLITIATTGDHSNNRFWMTV